MRPRPYAGCRADWPRPHPDPAPPRARSPRARRLRRRCHHPAVRRKGPREPARPCSLPLHSPLSSLLAPHCRSSPLPARVCPHAAATLKLVGLYNTAEARKTRATEGIMARLFSIKPAVSFKGRSFLGIRGWSGKPTHPPLTDFPIAAYVLAALFDVISFIAKGSHPGAARDALVAGTYVIIAGGVVSLGAALT